MVAVMRAAKSEVFFGEAIPRVIAGLTGGQAVAHGGLLQAAGGSNARRFLPRSRTSLAALVPRCTRRPGAPVWPSALNEGNGPGGSAIFSGNSQIEVRQTHVSLEGLGFDSSYSCPRHDSKQAIQWNHPCGNSCTLRE